jgi:hypothetical protein
MIRRLVLAGALVFGAATFTAPPAHALYCEPEAADVCATYDFACARLAAHNVYTKLCQLS